MDQLIKWESKQLSLLSKIMIFNQVVLALIWFLVSYTNVETKIFK